MTYTVLLTIDGPLLSFAKRAGAYLSTERLPANAWPGLAVQVLDEIRWRYVIGLAPRVPGRLDDVAIRVARPGTTVRINKIRKPARTS